METLQRPGLRADLSSRPEQDAPAVPEAAVSIARAGRSRLARLELAREIDAEITRNTDIAMPREGNAADGQSRMPRVVARQSLTTSDDRLLADAREGTASTRRDLLMRASKRVALPPAEVARGLGGAIRRDSMTVPVGLGTRRPRDPVSRLAAMILGVREREVFLARRVARPGDVAALHELAACLGISAERVYELEASARRKLTRALG